MSTINFPVMYINNPAQGRPIFNGQMYFGQPDLDPEIAGNQKQVYYVQENGSLVAASQPILLSVGGNPTYNGDAVTLSITGEYSTKVLSKLGVQEYYIARTDSSGTSGSVISYAEDSQVLAAGQLVVNFIGITAAVANIYVGKNSGDRGKLFEGDDYAVTGGSQITLTSSFSAGTKLIAASSELVERDDPSQSYEFDTILLMTGSTIEFPLNKTLITKGGVTPGDGLGATFLVTSASSTANDETLLDGKIATWQQVTSDQSSYDSTSTGMLSTNAQEAVDELYFGSLKGDRPVTIWAHRGFNNVGMQNTMLAFTRCKSMGADALETDVQWSADGTFYLFHDATVDSLTNGTGNFNTLTDSYIDTLKFTEAVGTKYEDTKIPKLTEFLEYANKANMRITPELKYVWSDPQMQGFLDVLDLYNYNNNRCVINDGYIVHLQTLRVLSTSVSLAYLGAGDLASATPFIDILSGLGNSYLLWNQFELLAEDFTGYCYSKGVDIMGYTTVTTNQKNNLVAAGICHIVSDVPFIEGIV
ncbi:MAG: glycerophosphoryl diester phosphodiesterase [Enterobacterales bacterium]|jgi:glycerophosphoryl diester phosphodiesterase